MKSVKASIITIGDELLIGQTIDTNSAFISKELNNIGIWVQRRIAIGDDREEILKTLTEEVGTSQIIIVTGGLGPTADDITKQVLCEFFDSRLTLDREVLKNIESLFEKVYGRPGPLLERNRLQAEVPENCDVLHNPRGTAPGMWFGPEVLEKKLASIKPLNPAATDNKTVLVSIPGVPDEMKGLVIKSVIPRLIGLYELPAILHRTVVTAGLGESSVAELLTDFEKQLPSHIKLAYLPSYGMVKLRLSLISADKESAEKEMEPFVDRLVKIVDPYLVTDDDLGLEKVIGQVLKSKNKTVATAESCTGGYIAHLITSVPGSSDYFKGSVVSYANELKESILGVDPGTLSDDGAVSEKTVREMVKGAIVALKADYVVATSGIMGPGGGTDQKPVGTVWIAVGCKNKTETLRLSLRFDRNRNIAQTAVQSLNFLRKFIMENS